MVDDNKKKFSTSHGDNKKIDFYYQTLNDIGLYVYPLYTY